MELKDVSKIAIDNVKSILSKFGVQKLINLDGLDSLKGSVFVKTTTESIKSNDVV